MPGSERCQDDSLQWQEIAIEPHEKGARRAID
jgi:hypothetical protein